MSEDRREAILSRILVILTGIKDFTTVVRNQDEMPERSRPAAILLDGDETISATSNATWESTYIMLMTPVIAIGVSSSPENIGPESSALRASVLKAILSDGELKTIIGKNGKIIYDGCNGRISHGSLMACDLQINLSIHYPLIVKNL